MNQILLFKEDFIDKTTVVLEGRRFEHIKEFLVRDNLQLKVGIMNGNSGEGRVIRQNENAVELSVTLNDLPPEPMDITLIIAMPRPKVLRRIIQHGTSLGIKNFFIIKTWKVEKSYWSTPLLSEKSLLNDMILGLEQSCDTVLPKIYIKKYFKPFVEDELPDIIKDKTAFVAHPGVNGTLDSIKDKKIVFAIGPEGGFIPYEIEMFLGIGFDEVSLGERILRVETVIPFILGKVLL